jgi:hypothetical protein
MKTKLNQRPLLIPAFADTPKFPVHIRSYRDGVHRRFSGLGVRQRKLIDLGTGLADAAPSSPVPNAGGRKGPGGGRVRERQETIRRREMEHALAV